MGEENAPGEAEVHKGIKNINVKNRGGPLEKKVTGNSKE